MRQASLRERARAHADETPDAAHRSQVREWLRAGDDAALQAAFEPPLKFGTAGVRAPLGPGDARINRLTVRRLVAGLCSYLSELSPDAGRAGLCVGFDGRHGSATFAQDADEVAEALGFRVRRFESPVPTPLLAHATRRSGAAAGVMITASHNPPGDNGVKVFWQGGRPLLPPHDEAIAARMQRASLPARRGVSEGPNAPLTSADLEAYLDDLCSVLPAAAPGAPAPRVTYSAMCGVGAETTRRLSERLGLAALEEVADECVPEPDFPGLVSPNPEHPEALGPSLTLAAKTGSDLVLVHDPDADRLAVAVPDEGGRWQRLTGDEVGCLMADFLLRQHATRPSPAAVVTTLVSSELSGRIADDYGALSLRVPTGVKWISQAGRALEREGRATYLFGYEEALGYCLPSLGDDKDGLMAFALCVRCWQHERAHGRGLLEARDALFAAHGIHRTLQRTWRFESSQARMSVVRALAAAPPQQLGDARTPEVEQDPRAPDLRVLRYSGDDCTLRVALRPSGTEPKLKAYLELRGAPTDVSEVRQGIALADAALLRAANALDLRVRALLTST